jgi:xylan 1,4-beta-xylosidase
MACNHGALKLAARPFLTVFFIATNPAVGQGQPAREPGVSSTYPVAIHIDAAKTRGEMRPVWRFFGYDEPNYTYMKDGVRLLGQLRRENRARR